MAQGGKALKSRAKAAGKAKRKVHSQSTKTKVGAPKGGVVKRFAKKSKDRLLTDKAISKAIGQRIEEQMLRKACHDHTLRILKPPADMKASELKRKNPAQIQKEKEAAKTAGKKKVPKKTEKTSMKELIRSQMKEQQKKKKALAKLGKK